MTNIVITGASGRMGRALIEATLEAEDASLSGATVRDAKDAA
jgi:dihydrodipicolinate reductase